MLVGSGSQYVRASFENEAEIEQVVHDYAELLFGSASIYLPKTRITTIAGKGTIPDGCVIDLEGEEWYLVEAERASHGTWEHIAPQVSKQLTALSHPDSLSRILQLALQEIEESARLRDLLKELGLKELSVHGQIQRILAKPPTIAIPIDEVPPDLLEWAATLKTSVRIWKIEKYLREEDGGVLYMLPEDATPTIDTTSQQGSDSPYRGRGGNLYARVLKAGLLRIGETLHLEYGPRGGKKGHFEATVRPDGLEVDGTVFSPSYAAVHCMRKAGSQRQTANGWVMWRRQDGSLMDDLVSRLPAEAQGE
jgi:hypothetical protein